MVASIVTGLAKTIGSQIAKKGVKKIAVKKAKSNKKIPKKSKLISSRENEIEENSSTIKDSGEKTISSLTGSSKKLIIKEASSSKSQVEQLKINVTNIHSFLKRRNKKEKRLKEKNRRLTVQRIEKEKLQREEKRLESPLGNSLKKVKSSVISAPGMSLFDKLLGFGSLVLAGILVNGLPAIFKEIKEFVDNLVSFITPIYSGFVLLKAVIDGEPLDDPELNPEKKRMSDQVKKLKKEIEKIKKNFGPLGFVITPFEKLVDAVFKAFRGDKIVLATKTEIDAETGEEKVIEGFKDLETDTFMPRDFTDAERDSYNRQRAQRIPDTNIPGSYSSGAYIGPTGDTDGQETGLNMNLDGGIGTPIYAPFDMIYKSTGTDGNPSVGLDGTSSALGPSGKGFGYYGAYRYMKGNKEYEVLMGHFKNLPFKGKEGQKIPKGTLLGYQGASGRSVPGPGNPDSVYPHISLHVNGIGFRATNRELKSFATKLSGAKPNANVSAPGEGGGRGKSNQIQTISQRDPRKRSRSITIAVQQVNTIQTAYVPMPIPMKSRGSSSSTQTPQLSALWSV